MFEYDAHTNRWRTRPLPRDAVTNPHEAFWTGSAVLVRGDHQTCGDCSGTPENEMSASFDPRTNTWTPLPKDPLTAGLIGSDNLNSAWTGSALWSINGLSEETAPHAEVGPGDTTLYDATTHTWSRLPRAPGACEGKPAWTGSEVLMLCQRIGVHGPPGNASGIVWIAIDRTAALRRTVNAFLDAHPKLRDRGLFRFDANDWVLITDGPPIRTIDKALLWSAGGPLFRWDGTRWTIAAGTWSTSVDRCFSAGGESLAILHRGHDENDGKSDYMFAVTFDPGLRIQERVGAHWETLPTVGGVYFALRQPQSLLLDDGQLRPVDQHGHVPACFADNGNARQ
ncbi:MAG TPA: hypothetical protein VGO03_02535 [Acidimicrobiia bacterium]